MLLSVFKSREVYQFHVKLYYHVLKGENHASLVRELRAMFVSAQKSNKKGDYADLKDYSERIILLYPEDPEIGQVLGVSYIKLGDGKKGAQYIAASANGIFIPDEFIDEVISEMFRQRYYSDIVSMVERQNREYRPEVMMFYGVSLYNMGKYERAIDVLRGARNKGVDNAEVYLYLGLSYKKLKNYDGAVINLKLALGMNSADRSIRRELVETYRALKRYEDAEKVLRLR
jgi:tetratricopeptide (TPR) repeat protein